jgi:hypothetical protein
MDTAQAELSFRLKTNKIMELSQAKDSKLRTDQAKPSQSSWKDLA